LEAELADWLQGPRALLFGSGYMANLAVVHALLGDGDLCVQDRLNHASLIDAARLAGCALKRYPHADAAGAARQLDSHHDGAALLASDGVFSMDGDVAPLRALAQVAREQQATLYIDDAHGIGVLGEAGRGSVQAAGLAPADVPLRLVTFGKALGSVGAAVVGDADLVAHLAEAARPYIYTTALPPAQVAATREAVRLAQAGDDLRERLHANIDRLKGGARSHGLALLESDTPIQPLVVGSDTHALAMAAELDARGYWVAAIRPPTVPEGSARLRITLSAGHDVEQIDGLLDALAQARDAVMP
jgi:8-amino-7-oxononanoate synthase